MNDDAPILVYDGMTSDVGEVFEYARAAQSSLYQEICPYCRTQCAVFNDETVYSTANQHDSAAICRKCGWWSFELDQTDLNDEGYFYSSRALLKRFSVGDDDVPYEALIEYISRNSDKLFDVSPKKFEEIVANVYRDTLGYRPEFVSYGRPDRGIDVVAVQVESGEYIAIQAKRYKQPIELGQIHQFFGAIVEARAQTRMFYNNKQIPKRLL